MKRLLPIVMLAIAFVYVSTTAFQCGSAELTSAKLYMSQKQYQKAEEALLKSVTKNDKDEEAWFLLGQVRLELKNYAGMNDAYTKCLAAGQTHANDIYRNRLSIWGMMYNDGVKYYNVGRDTAEYFDRAVSCFQTAIMMQPDSSSTYYVAALAQYAKKNNAAARELLGTSLAKRRDNPEASRFKGQLEYSDAIEKMARKDSVGARADLKAAVASFELAYETQPSNADNIANLIEVYDRLGENEKAASVTKTAVEKDPSNKTFRFAYGVFLLKKEMYSEASEQFKKSLEIDPNYGDGIYNLGVTYLNWGVKLKDDNSKRLEAEKKKTGKEPKEDLSYKEKFKMALPYLEKSAELRPDDGQLWLQLGRLYAILNMKDKSEAAFKKSDSLLKSK
jgi:tetratricopeptide (TPR) repeat protein